MFVAKVVRTSPLLRAVCVSVQNMELDPYVHVVYVSTVYELANLSGLLKYPRSQLRRVSHFHFYENLVAANLGMRFALWQLRAATRNS